MAKTPVKIQFPFGGLNRRSGYQAQPPYTTPDCLNVRPFDTVEHRQRGGIRPGMKKTFAQRIGSGNPIRMLANVTSTGTSVPEWTIAVLNASDFSLNATFEKSGLNLIMTSEPVIWPYMPEGKTFTQTITGDASSRNLIFKALDGFSGVTSISITGSYMSGSFPTMTSFANLTKIDFSDNLLTGTIPDLSTLTFLEELNLSENDLTGSDSVLSSLSSLKKLTLSKNRNFTWSSLPATLTELYYVDDTTDSTVRNIDWSGENMETVEIWNCNTASSGSVSISAPKTSLKLRNYLVSSNTSTETKLYIPPTTTSVDISSCNLKEWLRVSYGTGTVYNYFEDLITLNASNNAFKYFGGTYLRYAYNLQLLDLSGNSLVQSFVDSIIHTCLLNAQDRPTSGGSTVPICTLKLEGGANQTPSAAGASEAYQLRSLGWTVTHS